MLISVWECTYPSTFSHSLPIKWIPLGQASPLSVIRACLSPCEKSPCLYLGAIGRHAVWATPLLHGKVLPGGSRLLFFCLFQHRTSALCVNWAKGGWGPQCSLPTMQGVGLHSVGGGCVGEGLSYHLLATLVCNWASVSWSWVGWEMLCSAPPPGSQGYREACLLGHTCSEWNFSHAELGVVEWRKKRWWF